MIVVPVDDVGFPRQILRPIRYNDALITQNLGASPQQRCKDSNFVTATPQAQCEIDCHNLGAGTPTQGTVCCKHAHLKPYLVHHATLRGLSSRGLRPVVIQRPPQNVLLVRRRVWLWRMFHEAVCRRRSWIVGERTRHWRDAIIRAGEPYDGDTTRSEPHRSCRRHHSAATTCGRSAPSASPACGSRRRFRRRSIRSR